MVRFDSRAIAAADYDAETRQLSIWFRQGGGPYIYYGVPEHIFDGLCAATSKGVYYHTFIGPTYGRG